MYISYFCKSKSLISGIIKCITRPGEYRRTKRFHKKANKGKLMKYDSLFALLTHVYLVKFLNNVTTLTINEFKILLL